MRPLAAHCHLGLGTLYATRIGKTHGMILLANLLADCNRLFYSRLLGYATYHNDVEVVLCRSNLPPLSLCPRRRPVWHGPPLPLVTRL
jgi:hypothetical protein